MRFYSRMFLPFFAAALLCTTGCTWFVLGAGAGAAGVAYSMGKLTVTKDFSLPTVYDASVKAVQDLGIKMISNKRDELSGSIRGRTADNKDLYIDLKRLSEHSTKLTIYTMLPDKTQVMQIYDKIDQNLQ